MAQHYDLTSVGVNPADDRAHRMRVYFIAMSVRIACVASLFFVRGWWILVVGLAAVILPYFAVIFANERTSAPGAHPDAPTPREITGGAAPGEANEGSASASETLLIVDAPADRRSAGSEPAGERTSAAHEDAPRRDEDAE